MFQRNINSDGAASQDFAFADAGSTIDSTSSVVAADTSGGAYTLLLPDQVAAAGLSITVVSVDATSILTIGVQTGDALDGTTDGTVAIAAGVGYASLTFVSTGSSWANV